MSAPRRRTVIVGSAAAAATTGSAAATASSARAAPAAAKPPADLLKRSRFSPLVGKTFTMSSGAGKWSVVLSAVEDLTPGGAAGAEKQFAAAFSGSGAGPRDGVYAFSRSGFTSTSLFVVADGAGRHYRATVNRF